MLTPETAAKLVAWQAKQPAFVGKPGQTLGGKAERRAAKSKLVRTASKG